MSTKLFSCEPCEDKPCGALVKHGALDSPCDCTCHGNWTAAFLKCPHCELTAVHVFPADVEEIECSCNRWFDPLRNTVNG